MGEQTDPDWFPPLENALREPPGLPAAGGDLKPARLLAAYERGVFPWYSSQQPILWWSPDPRMVLFPEEFVCSRSLAKTLRNGPCGGVRANGHCEVKPEMRCVWLKGYDRAEGMPGLPKTWRAEYNHMRPPVDNRLKNTSSWANYLSKRDRQTPAGWQPGDDE